MSESSFGLADPHCHTLASDGMVNAQELVEGARERGLSLIAVTDHDTMAAVQEARRWGAELGVAVVAGQEVTTAWPAQTHLLGWFLERPIRRGMSLRDTVDAIHEQGGLAVMPHPFMPTYFGSCQPGMLRSLLESRRLDAIEMMTTAPMTPGRRRALERFCARHQEGVGALVAGSDSHFGPADLGQRVTRFPGASEDDFRRAVEGRTTEPRWGPNPGSVPLSLRLRQQRRSLFELPWRRLRGGL